MELLYALLTAVVVGALAGLVTYAILWLVSLVVRIEESTRRSIALVVGVLVALVQLLTHLNV